MTYPQPPYGQQPYGQQYGGNPYGPPPENNLVWAILCTVLCCLPLGIVAIIKANEVNSLWYQGQHAAAQKSADDAKKWAMWGALSTLILIVLYIVVVVLILGVGIFGATSSL